MHRTELEPQLYHRSTLVEVHKLSESCCFYVGHGGNLMDIKGLWGLNGIIYVSAGGERGTQ